MKGINTIKIIMAVLFGLICILLFITGFLIGDLYGSKKAVVTVSVDKKDELRGTVVNKKNMDEVSEKKSPERKKVPTSYEVIMNTEWIFNNTGKESFNAYVENSRDNSNTVRILLSYDDQPDKILYTSDELPVGDKLQGIRLDDSLPKGRSKAIVTYQLLDDEGSIVGEVKAGVTLVYEE